MNIKYRPEIDGLRAISVIAVVIYHADIVYNGISIFSGGFLGVDIFLVISGYLITSLILKELKVKKTFSIINFYERRARRILPALLGVILFSIPFAWKYLLPPEFLDYSKSIIYTIFFGSNFYFHFSGLEYGAQSSLLKPFLHTWSLAVEEQFYIIFPILFVFTYKFYRKHISKVLWLGFIVSLFLAEWSSRNYSSLAFYFLHTRMWEILLGSLLAYYSLSIKKKKKSLTLAKKFCPSIGLVFIFFSFIFYQDEMFHPSILTIIPVSGVALIIWFSSEKDFITQILSTKLLVSIGLISYSLYLFHYPFFSFARITGLVSGDFLKKIVLVLLILITSYLSYILIEKPFRNKKLTSKKKLLYFLGFCTTILLIFNFYVLSQGGIKKRLPEILQNEIKNNNVIFNEKGKKGRVVLIGDSHARTLEFHLNNELIKKDFKLKRFFTDFYITNFNLIDRKTKKKNKEFVLTNKEIFEFLKEEKNLIIVLHHRFTVKYLETYFDNQEGEVENSYQKNRDWEEFIEPINKTTNSKFERKQLIEKAFLENIEEIKKFGHEIILIYPVPEMAFNVPRKIYNDIVIEKNQKIKIFSSSYNVFTERNKEIFKLFDKIDSNKLHRVYPHTHFCNKLIKNRCVANSEKEIYYWDDDHLSLQGSRLVVKDIINKINLMKDNK